MAITGPTSPETKKVKAEFKTRFQRQIAITLLLLPAIIVAAMNRRMRTESIFGIPGQTLIPIAIVFIFGGIGLSLWNWRCPGCNKYLGKSFYPKHCSGCGAQLRD